MGRALFVRQNGIKRNGLKSYWGRFNANKQNHNTNYGGIAAFGLPKYWSCTLLSTKDSTHAHSR